MSFLNKHYKLVLFLIPIISLAMHWQIFNKDLVGIHVWRQTQTQTVVNNFYREDMNIFHPRINEFRNGERIIKMEFPVMQWVFAVFHKVLGSDVIISRILTFILGLLSTFGLFYLLNRLFKNIAIATLGAWTFTFSPLFYYYTVNPLPDNFSLCCGIWSVGLLFRHLESRKNVHLFISAILLSLATLAKLPFILYGAAAFVAMVRAFKKRAVKDGITIALAYALSLLSAIIWYARVIPTWGDNEVLKGVLDNWQDRSSFWQLIQHNLVSALPEMLLNYASVLFFLSGFYFLYRNRKTAHSYFPMLLGWAIAIVAYFLFEINAIGTVHDYYLMPFLPLLFILVAYGAYHLLNNMNKFVRVFSLLLLMLLPLTAFLRIQNRWNTGTPNFNPVYYQYKEELRNLIPPNALCVAGNDDSHFILLYYIDRKGWAFDNDQLNGTILNEYIGKGARYLFIDSRIDEQADIQTHLEEEVFNKENLRVYKLK